MVNGSRSPAKAVAQHFHHHPSLASACQLSPSFSFRRANLRIISWHVSSTKRTTAV